MQALLKKTGQACEFLHWNGVSKYENRICLIKTPNGEVVDVFEEDVDLIPEPEDDFDWLAYRNEVAKDLLVQCVSNSDVNDFMTSYIPRVVAVATQLVEELKKVKV